MDRLFRVKLIGLCGYLFLGLLATAIAVVFIPWNNLFLQIILFALVALCIVFSLGQKYQIKENGDFIFTKQTYLFSQKKMRVNVSDIVSVQWCGTKSSTVFLLEYTKSGASEYANLFPQNAELLLKTLQDLNPNIKVTALNR